MATWKSKTCAGLLTGAVTNTAVKQNLCRHNTPSLVQAKTKEAIGHYKDPGRAIGAVMDLQKWGLTYGSKTLMFMIPFRLLRFSTVTSAEPLPSSYRLSVTVTGFQWCEDIRCFLKFVPGSKGRSRGQSLGPRQSGGQPTSNRRCFRFAQSGGTFTR